jgi:hypothetical protein
MLSKSWPNCEKRPLSPGKHLNLWEAIEPKAGKRGTFKLYRYPRSRFNFAMNPAIFSVLPIGVFHLRLHLDASINATILRGWAGSIGFRAGFCLPWTTGAVFAMFKAPDEGNYRSCRRDAPQEEQAFDIVDEVRQSDLRLRSRDPDGPDEQTHPILLLGEDMLDVSIWRY